MKQEKKVALSTQGYRGTRDFYPKDMRLLTSLYQKIHIIMHSFGYEEYSGPFLEFLDLYAAKTSEEIVREQLYSLKDKGDRTLAIRPEMTPTLARMVAAKSKELPKPIRWYSIPTCMRFERPQRGRLREFNQLNVDVLGGNVLDEDIEILLTIINIFESLGASFDKFRIYINHRGLVDDFFSQVLKINQSTNAPLLRLLDKKDKLSEDEFTTECLKLDLLTDQIEQINSFLSADIDDLCKLFVENNEHVKILKDRIDIVNKISGSECVQFSPSITRGFDYYTGIVFEVFDMNPENRRALFGGGRYDNLVSAFGCDSLPGVGYGVSDVALLNFMETHKLTPELKRTTDVCVLRFQETDRMHQLELAQNLRKHELSVESSITNIKFGKQIAYANRICAKSVAFRGEDEIKNKTFCVKFLDKEQQIVYPYSSEGFEDFKKQLF